MSTSDKETYMELLMVEEEKNKQLQAENKELRKALEFEKTKDRHMIGINKVLTNNAQKELDERSKLQAEIGSLKAEKGMADMEIRRLEAQIDEMRRLK